MATPSKISMGLFALFAALFSLWRMLPEREYARLVALKRHLGRKEGLMCFFLADVATPMVLGIAFVAQGVVEISSLGISMTMVP